MIKSTRNERAAPIKIEMNQAETSSISHILLGTQEYNMIPLLF